MPLIEAGFVDWIISTGANVYHDLHFAFNMPLRAGSPAIPDTALREHRIVRIYDVFLHYDDVLLATDAVLRDILKQPEFERDEHARVYLFGWGATRQRVREQRRGP